MAEIERRFKCNCKEVSITHNGMSYDSVSVVETIASTEQNDTTVVPSSTATTETTETTQPRLLFL